MSSFENIVLAQSVPEEAVESLDEQALAVAPPVNVDDCLTATRALGTGILERDFNKNLVGAYAVIGGVAVAALTRKLVNQSQGITSIMNVSNVVLRQTKMSSMFHRDV